MVAIADGLATVYIANANIGSKRKGGGGLTAETVGVAYHDVCALGVDIRIQGPELEEVDVSCSEGFAAR